MFAFTSASKSQTTLAFTLAAGFPLVASASYQSEVLGLNPDHYWQLNETTIGTAVDSVGSINGTHAGDFGTGLGAVGVAGPDNAPGLGAGNLAFGAFDNASIGLGTGSALANSTMTVAMWFQVNSSQGGDRLWTNNQADGNTSFQITFGGGFGDTAASLVIGLNPAINGFPGAGLPSGSSVGNFHIPDSTVSLKDNQWHHIVASRNGNNIEDVLVVIDGVHYGTDTWADSTDTWGTTGTDAQIGTRTPGNGGASRHVANGSLDEVAVWLGTQLSIADSISLYNAAIDAGFPVGDIDFDGDVDIDDLGILAGNWQQSISGVANGDLDDDNDVDIDDLGLLAGNWQFGVAAGAAASDFDDAVAAAGIAVPEPTSLALLMLGGLAMTQRRR